MSQKNHSDDEKYYIISYTVLVKSNKIKKQK